ncbi:MAG: DNA polymerase I [bacterium]|nr:DNA polymerase I [bacterium]
MKKIILIDGNNLMFRSYYATFYSGANMKNSKGLPTNALFSFVTMINKIIKEENPEYIAVAFDIGKNFRKKEFSFYKEGRQNTPDELKLQMPYARKILNAMGIKYLELEPYEADDIIGTLTKMILEDEDYDATIISSDKDLLQLINYETDVKLLKQSGFIRYNEKTFKEEFGIDPINIIDLKALMGDSSDNIPGVKGIGEKGALKLLREYKTIENLYDNIDKINGSTHDKLVTYKEDAFMSKKIATIYQDVPLNINLNDLKYAGPNNDLLYEIFSELEFNSLLSSLNKEIPKEKLNYIKVDENINVITDNTIALYIEIDNENYTMANILSAVIYDGKFYYYFSKENLKYLNLNNKNVITYDYKKDSYLLNTNFVFEDFSLISYLNGTNIKDDISVLSIKYGYEILSYNNLIKLYETDEYIQNELLKVKFMYDKINTIKEDLRKINQYEIYENIEKPLAKVLSSMEKEGIKVDKNVLNIQKEDIEYKLKEITNKIYDYAGEEFNISSPKQLSYILFEKMQLAKGKKNKTSYKTDVNTLEKLINVHPIINLILEYRGLAKLNSTYIDGLKDYIQNDDKIHSIFKQTVARTGRLSSVHPNLQNIPVKDEEGKNIRKAFLPSNDLFLSLDYSQIELRILADIANSQTMIETFNNGEDIHAKVASDIHNKDIKDVSKEERSAAKSVIFGIVYGISGFGLGENLHISKNDADKFIKKYYELYPEVKTYMDNQINFAKENGFIETKYGRKRYISEINDANFMVRKSGERMAINSPIQGTAADIIKMAMIKINDIFIKEGIQSKLVLQIHDELIFDVKKEELEKIINIVKYEMENIVKLKVPLKVSTDTGINWYDIK